jgi:hypothetical protein
MMMKRYILLVGDDTFSLEETVTRYIEMGWVPQGGPIISISGSRYVQAMIFPENKSKKS